MNVMRNLVVFAFVLLGLATSATAQTLASTKWGVSVSGSPISGWGIAMDKSSGSETKSRVVEGSAIELAFSRDHGPNGDKGVILTRKELNGKIFMGAEVYNFMPFLKSKYVQFGPTVGVGAGVGSGAVFSGRAEATLAVRTGPNVKVKLGAGLDYPRLQAVRISASYLF